MRIRKIKFTNHPVFGDLEFDFTINGKTVDTIIVAGENGSGKSLLLNAIYEFSLMQKSLANSNQLRQIEVEFPSSTLRDTISESPLNSLVSYPIKDNLMVFNTNYNQLDHNQTIIEYENNHGLKARISSIQFGQTDLRELAKTIFADVAIYYNVEKIDKITSSEFDRELGISQRSTKNSTAEISQLLVDLQAADNDDFANWANNNPGRVNSEFVDKDKRINRFKNAFNFMFPKKRMIRLSSEGGSKKVVFKEFENEIFLNDLSSGEKQIAFRGSFLLRDKGGFENALVLIDEPEISLHPNWQLKILEFYKRLFQSEKGEQTSQIIIATHSPFILHNSNRYNDKVIVLKRNSNGKTEIEQEPSFYGFSNEELIEKAFNTRLLSGNDKLTFFVEGVIDQKYIKKVKEIFKGNDFEIIASGINEDGGSKNGGIGGLNKLYNVLLTNPSLIDKRKNKIILLYDFDANKKDENYDKFLIRSLKKNEINHFKGGIENSLCMSEAFDSSSYFMEKSQTNGDNVNINKSLDKRKLCDWICDTLEEDKQKEILKELNDTINAILKEL